MKITANARYSFSELERFLYQDGNQNKHLIVRNVRWDQKAVMHVFWENFQGDWKRGDGVLFYADGEVHSSEPHDEYEVLSIVEI